MARLVDSVLGVNVDIFVYRADNLLELFTARTILVYLNLLRKLSINIPRTILVSRY